MFFILYMIIITINDVWPLTWHMELHLYNLISNCSICSTFPSHQVYEKFFSTRRDLVWWVMAFVSNVTQNHILLFFPTFSVFYFISRRHCFKLATILCASIQLVSLYFSLLLLVYILQIASVFVCVRLYSVFCLFASISARAHVLEFKNVGISVACRA